MLFNLIEALTGLTFDFPATDNNTVIAGTIHKTGSQITREFDRVAFVELKKDDDLYVETDKRKDLVIAIGPWRKLAFVDMGAGSGVGEVLKGKMKKMENSQIGNMALVSAAGDGLFNALMSAVEDKEKAEKDKKSEPTADSSSGSEKPAKQPQRRPKSKPEPTADDYFGSEKPAKQPQRRRKFDPKSQEVPQPRRKSAAFVDLSNVDDEDDDD